MAGAGRPKRNHFLVDRRRTEHHRDHPVHRRRNDRCHPLVSMGTADLRRPPVQHPLHRTRWHATTCSSTHRPASPARRADGIVRSFAKLREGGHRVHTPDLYRGHLASIHSPPSRSPAERSPSVAAEWDARILQELNEFVIPPTCHVMGSAATRDDRPTGILRRLHQHTIGDCHFIGVDG